MPEATAVIKEVKKVASGTNARGPWELNLVIDGNEEAYSTLKAEQVELANNLVGRKAKLTYEVTEKGKRLSEIAGPLDDDTPVSEPGIRAATNPNDKRGMAASTALKAAVDALSHTLGSDARAKEASERVIPLADEFFLWLTGKAGVQEPDDVPFG